MKHHRQAALLGGLDALFRRIKMTPSIGFRPRRLLKTSDRAMWCLAERRAQQRQLLAGQDVETDARTPTLPYTFSRSTRCVVSDVKTMLGPPARRWHGFLTS